MRALAAATREAVAEAGVAGDRRRGDRARHHGIQRDPGGCRDAVRSASTTCGATIAPRARRRRSPRRRTASGLEAIEWCGGVYSAEWGFSKLLHWLRHNPDKRGALRQRASSTATWWRRRCAGITDPRAGQAQRLRDGAQVDVEPRARRPAAGGVSGRRRSAAGRRAGETRRRVRDFRPDRRTSCSRLGGAARARGRAFRSRSALLTPIGTPSAPARGLGDVVNVVGTSTCIIAYSAEERLVPGVCGVVPGSVHPRYTGIEAGLSAVGDIFAAIARRAGTECGGTEPGTGELSRRPDRPLAPDLGQRRPHRAGECPGGRHHPRVEPAAHGAATSCSRRSRARPSTPASSSTAWRSTARPRRA